MLVTDIISALSALPSASECAIDYKCFGNGKKELESLEITNISCHSRDGAKGTIFVCIKGENFDGNEFIPMASLLGTLVFVSERRNAKVENGIIIFSNNVRKTMAEISKMIFHVPENKMVFVGITGTKGKSTVCELLAAALRSFGIKTLSVGTLGACLEERQETENTTPPSHVLYRLIYEAYISGARACIIEVSSQALRDMRVFGIKFDIVAFTSFGIDHIGRGEHKSLSEYICAKRLLFTSYGAELAVLNYDDPYSSYFGTGVKKVLLCGKSRGANLKIQNVKSGLFGMSFSLSGIRKSYRLAGGYNATNIAIAAGIAEIITNKPLNEILDVMTTIRVNGRFESYYINSRYVVIDYAHNEKSLSAIIKELRGAIHGRIVVVFGSVGGRSEIRRRSLANVAASLADFSLITSDNPGFEGAFEIAEEIYAYFDDKKRAEILVDREMAIRRAFEITNPGDCILLVGKGHERYMENCGEKIFFSEKDVLFEIKKESQNKK